MKIDVGKKLLLKKRCWSDCSIPENQALWKVEKKGSVPLINVFFPFNTMTWEDLKPPFFIPDQ